MCTSAQDYRRIDPRGLDRERPATNLYIDRLIQKLASKVIDRNRELLEAQTIARMTLLVAAALVGWMPPREAQHADCKEHFTEAVNYVSVNLS